MRRISRSLSWISSTSSHSICSLSSTPFLQFITNIIYVRKSCNSFLHHQCSKERSDILGEMKNTRGTFRNIHPNFLIGGRGDGDDNTKATLRNVKVFVMRVTHAPLYHSARCIFSWTVLPGTEGGGGVKNAWRTSPAAQHQDFRNRLLSCYRSLLFLPRSVRDTFLPCEIHTSSTSIRRGRGG